MKKTLLFFLVTTFIYGNTEAQTKLISYKSHSGNASNFKKALNNNLFNIEESNFGMAPQRMVRNSNLDTVKLLSPHVAVMITSETCKWVEYNVDDRSSTGELWSAGTDTVVDHPLFNSKNTISYIKTKLKEDYFFNNQVDKIVFIGFDSKYPTVAPRLSSQPVMSDYQVENKTERSASNQKNNDPGKRSYFMIILWALLANVFNTPF